MSAALLEARGIAKRFRQPFSVGAWISGSGAREVRALDDVDLDVHPGETLGIVGESGCGKSTLARCLVRLHEPDQGRIRYRGDDVLGLSGEARRAFNRRVQMVFQDPSSSLNPRLTVGETLAEPIRVHRLRPPEGIAGRVGELLARVHLQADVAGAFPHQLSGGQRQRVGIARALAVEPECLIADEPVSALDASVQAQIVNLLLELQRDLGLTMLFISHDLRLVRYVSHRVAVMYLGQIVELAETERLFTRPAHPYTAALIAAAPSLDPDQRSAVAAVSGELPSPLKPPAGCRFHPRCPRAETRCRVDIPGLDRRGEGSVACHFPLV